MLVTLRGTVLEAADAADQDNFGKSTALSADGLVLVVGATGRDNAGVDQGAVYTYDWVDPAWVQRGSPLIAADAANYEEFGASVALSADGLVLAVGASSWELSGTGATGGVYTYDRSGSAWVQRGAVLTHTSAASGDAFGSAVALSGDGLVLAVGVPGRDYTYTNQGRAYVYARSGSSWISEHLYDITFADPFDNFGASIALSSDGLVLAIGAPGWDTTSNAGGVFVYDYVSGTFYALRGDPAAPLMASDLAVDDFFGTAVSLSGDGAKLAVLSVRYGGGYTYYGRIYGYEWDGAAWLEPDPVITPTLAGDGFKAMALSADALVLAVGMQARNHSGGILTGTGGVYVYDVAGIAPSPSGISTAPTTLTVVAPGGISTAPTTLTVVASGVSSAPTTLAVIAPGHIPLWRARCLIDGVDHSARLVGLISVEAEEGAARIARLSLLPASGPLLPLDFVGRKISIDYVPVMNGVEVPLRLFTGRIDTPDYDLSSRLLGLVCVDDLQNVVAALDRTVIDGLSGGRYSVAVQGEILDNWDYAQAVMGTVAASMDAGPSGGVRVTPWDDAGVWATFGDGDLIYGQSSLTFPQRSTLINQVDIEFDYRFLRLRQRYTTLGWSGTLIDMAPCGYAYPTQQDILGAAGGSGWQVTLGIFWSAPAIIVHSSGGVIRPAADAIDMAILYLTQRHSQTVTEQYAIPVTAPESISENGALATSLRGALATPFDGAAWESALDVAPLMPMGGEQDYSPEATRADADHAIQTLLDQANVKILGSHRSARVSNAVLCLPDLDLDKRVAVVTSQVSAAGKVASVTHQLNLDTGAAISLFSVACFGVGGAGILTPDMLAPPTPPDPVVEPATWEDAIPPLFVNTYGVTPYDDNIMGLMLNPPESITVEDVPTMDGPQTQTFPNPWYVAGSYPVTGFRVRMPGVDDLYRNPIELPVESSYQIVVPDDPITLTVP